SCDVLLGRSDARSCRCSPRQLSKPTGPFTHPRSRCPRRRRSPFRNAFRRRHGADAGSRDSLGTPVRGAHGPIRYAMDDQLRHASMRLYDAPPNKRFKLPGGDRFKGSGVLCPWRARTIVQVQMRLRASRPQLKRDPLGGATTVQHASGDSTRRVRPRPASARDLWRSTSPAISSIVEPARQWVRRTPRVGGWGDSVHRHSRGAAESHDAGLHRVQLADSESRLIARDIAWRRSLDDTRRARHARTSGSGGWILFLGPPSTMTSARLSPALCADSVYMA